MADTNINEINEAADNGMFLQAAFEVIVSNSKNNDTQNVTGVAVDGSGNPIQAISGNIYVIDDTTLNEGYTAASLKNTNTVYMKLSAKSAVDGRPGDHTGLYAHNTYDVNKLTDGALVVNFPGKTLGLVTLAGERSDYTELIVGEKYKFAISNFYEAATYEVGDTFTVKNGVWKETASASITAGDVYAVLTKISSFTEGGLYAGDGYILEIKRKAIVNTDNELPDVTSADNGKILKVVNGDWTAEDNDFVVTFTKSNSVWSADKTPLQIQEAIEAKKNVYAKVNGASISLSEVIKDFTLILPLIGDGNLFNGYAFGGSCQSTQNTIFVTFHIVNQSAQVVTVSAYIKVVNIQEPLIVTYTITGQPLGNVYPLSANISLEDMLAAISAGRDVIAMLPTAEGTIVMKLVSFRTATGIEFVAFSAVTYYNNAWSIFQINTHKESSTDVSEGNIIPLSTAQMTFDSTTNTLAITQ